MTPQGPLTPKGEKKQVFECRTAAPLLADFFSEDHIKLTSFRGSSLQADILLHGALMRVKGPLEIPAGAVLQVVGSSATSPESELRVDFPVHDPITVPKGKEGVVFLRDRESSREAMGATLTPRLKPDQIPLATLSGPPIARAPLPFGPSGMGEPSKEVPAFTLAESKPVTLTREVLRFHKGDELPPEGEFAGRLVVLSGPLFREPNEPFSVQEPTGGAVQYAISRKVEVLPGQKLPLLLLPESGKAFILAGVDSKRQDLQRMVVKASRTV